MQCTISAARTIDPVPGRKASFSPLLKKYYAQQRFSRRLRCASLRQALHMPAKRLKANAF
jgi:hypothetical protein